MYAESSAVAVAIISACQPIKCEWIVWVLYVIKLINFLSLQKRIAKQKLAYVQQLSWTV